MNIDDALENGNLKKFAEIMRNKARLSVIIDKRPADLGHALGTGAARGYTQCVISLLRKPKILLTIVETNPKDLYHALYAAATNRNITCITAIMKGTGANEKARNALKTAIDSDGLPDLALGAWEMFASLTPRVKAEAVGTVKRVRSDQQRKG